MQSSNVVPFSRRKKQSILYKVISENINTFLELGNINGRVPDYIEKEFSSFLECGVLAYGLFKSKM